MLTPPSDAKIHDLIDSIVWFDDDGIVYAISKKQPEPTLEEIKERIESFKKLTDGQKVCILIDATNTGEMSREVRDYAAQEFPKIFKAIAIISGSALGKMMANLFFTIKNPPYPIKMFNDESEAKNWLEQYL